jgi:hypothetical protein
VTEIIKKIVALYKIRYNLDVKFSVKEVSGYDDLRGLNSAPIIALVHPDIATNTSVSVDTVRNVVYVYGGDSLKDFDRATEKMLMVAMGIEL